MLSQKFVQNLAKRFDLDLLILFGSRAKGVNRKESDLDIAFLSKRTVMDMEWDQFMTELMKESHCNRVDLINLKRDRGLLLHYEIFCKGKPIFESKPGLFHQKKIDAILNYSDARPVLTSFVKRKLQKFSKDSHA